MLFRPLTFSLLVFLSACASTGEQTATARLDSEPRPTAAAKVAADPRPIGVPDDATPEERGREVLRVIVELIKRRDIRDTEFASRLLRLPIEKDKGIVLLTPDLFPQQLVSRFSYSVRHSFLQIKIALTRARTCVLVPDLLDIFHRELGIGPRIINDRKPGQRPQVPPTNEGWYVYQGHRDVSSVNFISTPLGNGWGAQFSLRDNEQCIGEFIVDHFNTNAKR